MSASDQLLPTISTLVALGELAFEGQLESYGSDYVSDRSHHSHNQLAGNQLLDHHFAEAAGDKTVRDALPPDAKQQRAEREWQGAIAALNQFLAQHIRQQQSVPKKSDFKSSSKCGGSARSNALNTSPQALVLCGPAPLLSEPNLMAQVSNWIFVPHTVDPLASPLSALAPVGRLFHSTFKKAAPSTRLLPLLEDDPLLQERFALVFTPQFALVLVLGKDASDELRFQFSFMPEVVMSVWRLLRSRIRLTRRHQLDFIEQWVEKFAPQEPSYRTVSQFNRWLLASLPQPPIVTVRAAQRSAKAHSAPSHRVAQSARDQAFRAETAIADSDSHRGGDQGINRSDDQRRDQSGSQFSDSDLLKAMAHEIRTPLTTIRTYTRSLLKRQDLDAQVIQRLKSIDRECTQQIDRFSLIFRAVELEAASQMIQSPLSAIALHQVFQEAIPQWQQAAQRRNLSLEVGLPPELPMVASDPTMLQHVLTGLVELFTHSVSPGSHIQLHVLHAGAQLKLQFQSSAQPQTQSQNQSADQSASQSTNQSRDNHAFPANAACSPPPLKSLGHLLMFQPETGGLSLNLEATKNLFHALGAKLTVRERSNQGTTWTVFLPLEASGLKSYPIV